MRSTALDRVSTGGSTGAECSRPLIKPEVVLLKLQTKIFEYFQQDTQLPPHNFKFYVYMIWVSKIPAGTSQN